MRTAPRRFCSMLVAAALALACSHAFAQSPAADDEPAEPPPEPSAGIARPPAPDLRSGTFQWTLGAGYLAPLGSLTQEVDMSSFISHGLNLKTALGFGLSRHVSLEIIGAYGIFTGSESCPKCTGNSLNIGFGINYHLAQGIAFDPWASFGMGYRSLLIYPPGVDLAEQADSYTGLDFARFALGGTYYPASSLGFGPYLEGTAGTFRLVADPRGNPSVYGLIELGVRITFDPLRPGKLSTSSSSAR